MLTSTEAGALFFLPSEEIRNDVAISVKQAAELIKLLRSLDRGCSNRQEVCAWFFLRKPQRSAAI